MPKPAKREPLTTEQFAETVTTMFKFALWTAEEADAQAVEWLVSWTRGMPLTWRQFKRVQGVMHYFFTMSDATPAEQDAAAHSYDDEGQDRGLRKGNGSQTWRMLERAREMIGH
jgi:hypothetical protein